jgi:NitT/TauT family transport system substrate-binding protein
MSKFLFLLFFSIVLFFSGCKKSFFDKASPPPKKITIAYTFQPQCTLIHVAKEKGFFLEEGLDVTPSMHQFGKTALQAVLEHKADLATVAETPLLFSILNNDKIFIIATIVASSKNNAVLAKKDSGIKKAQDLKGKRIGFTPLTTSDFFLDSLLIANGLTRKEIIPVPLNPDDIEERFNQKKIDAVSTWNYPLIQLTKKFAENGILFFDQDIYTETFNLASMQDFAKNNPTVLKQVLKAVVKAQEFVKKNPKEAQEIMAKSTHTPLDLVSEVWDSFSFDVTLDQTIVITLEDEARWAIKNKLTKKTLVPDFEKYIYTDALKSVYPNYVKLKKDKNAY